MKFAEFIKEAGGNPKDYPRAAELLVPVYDRNGQLVTDSVLNYKEPTFMNNAHAFNEFFSFVGELEHKLERGEIPQSDLEEMAIAVPDAALIIRFLGKRTTFIRTVDWR